MATIGKNWNGHLYGTNTGNVALSLEGEDGALVGLLRFSDNNHGLVVYKVQGVFEQGALKLTGKPQGEFPEGIHYGDFESAGTLTPDGKIDGEWVTTIGSGGTFQLWPHTVQARRSDLSQVPEQLNTSTRSFGAVRLYASEVRGLISQVKKDFSHGRAVVTFNDKGNEKSIFSDEFEELLDELPDLRYLKIFIQEPELYGINRNASVEFSAWGENVIRVQSVQESWAIGKAESIARYANPFRRALANQFRKFGLTVNVIILVGVLAAIPDLPKFWQRVAFGGAAFGVQAAIAYFHRRFVPNFVFFPAAQKSNWLGRFGPGFVSWIITLFGGVAAALIYGLLKGELSGSPLAKVIGWN